MRLILVVSALLLSFALPVAAQPASTKTKSPPPQRTYLDSLDMSSSEAAMRGFLEAYAADDFFEAYFFLSPDAKQSIMNKLLEYNDAQLIPGMNAGGVTSGPVDGGHTGDTGLVQEVWLDGAVMFDRLMRNAEALSIMPFDFEAGAFMSPTFEQENQARYTVDAKGQPEVVIISTVRLSNGDWRVQRVVWATSDPDATPWGFK